LKTATFLNKAGYTLIHTKLKLVGAGLDLYASGYRKWQAFVNMEMKQTGVP